MDFLITLGAFACASLVLAYATLAVAWVAFWVYDWGVKQWRRIQIARGVEPVEVLEIEAVTRDGVVTDVRVFFLAQWWRTDEDVVVAKSQVPLILRAAGLPRIRILWTPGLVAESTNPAKEIE